MRTILQVMWRQLGEAGRVAQNATDAEHEKRAQLVQECKRWRVENGIALREMARRLGCAAATLSDIEHGRRWSDRLVREYVYHLSAPRRDATAGTCEPKEGE